MQLPHNPFKKALAEGRAPIGLWASLPSPYAVEVIAGVNLPMLIKLASVRRTEPLAEAVIAAREAGKKYIAVASALLDG